MNSSSIKTEKAIFAAGCFWGVEVRLQKAKGVLLTTVGFSGGDKENPTYNEVCSGRTGHAESVEVIYNPAETSFETLAKHFFEIHNPGLITNHDGQRSQYRSAIFFVTEEQKVTAEKLIKMLKEKDCKVATEISPAKTFYKAEEYHQDYYVKTGRNDYEHGIEKKF